jgi:ubiquinone/menaquinone biosynthesis C-methylase UbiE
MTMKMGTFEKRFVNATAHSRQVAEQTVGRLRHVPLHAGGRYLDVGCGNGLATLHVADTLGLRAVGVDLDPAQIELARRAACSRTDVSFVTASATQLPFATAAFDIVSTNKTMHHVPEWWLALDEIKRVAAPGGYVVFADLNVPLALAPLLRPAVGHVAGVFTRRDLDRCFSGLCDVHRSARWLHYEAVFAKP